MRNVFKASFSEFLSVLSLLSLCSVLVLSGCDTDNTPAPKALTPLISSGNSNFKLTQVWSRSLTQGSEKKYVTLGPVLDQDSGKLITADYRGEVVLVDVNTHKILWDVKTHEFLGGTPSVSNQQVYLGTLDGKLIALDESSGKTLWQAKLSSSLLASPVGVSGGVNGQASGMVLAYTHDGNLTAFSSLDGHQLWQYLGDPLPNLIMAGEANPVIVGSNVVIGTHSGQLLSLSLSNGQVNWQRPIAIPSGGTDISQMVDVVGNPVFDSAGNGVLYAVTYHGNLVAIDPVDGSLLWEHPLSSLKALALSPSAAGNAVIATNDQGDVLAFDRDTGRELWNQSGFEYRFTTAPALLNTGLNNTGNSVVIVGDYQGYIHCLDLKNGQEIARVKMGSHIIAAAPVVFNQNVYLTDEMGKVVVYKIN